MRFGIVAPKLIHLPEPGLAFGFGQVTDHPKDGLFLYGPHRADDRKKVITIGVIGTKDGLGFFRTWASGVLNEMLVPPPKKTDKEKRLHLSNFPGMPAAFGVSFVPDDFIEYEISADRIGDTTAIENHHEAVAETVEVYLDRVRHHDENEERRPDVWVFVLPEIIYARCTRLARRSGVILSPGEYVKRQKQRSSLPLLEDIIDLSKENFFDDVPDFHRQAKAKLLRLGYTSQLVRETTLAPDAFTNKHGYPIRGVQDAATIAWNLATGLYYKTQAEPPWKIADMRAGVCYVGLVFKNLPNDKNDHACCAAQMFLSEGDGIVFRGANGPWQTEDGEFHLKKDAAKDLIGKVLETYKEKFGLSPKELFIHGRAGFSKEEWEAFESAAPEDTNIVGVRIRPTTGQVKLFREGKYPTMRGTAIMVDNNNAFLWTSGYAPRLDTYIGPETPNPLSVTVMKSTGGRPALRTVLADILALTKINYNACNYSDGLPVTIRFANKVGDVLVMGSAKGSGKQPFKFYI
jgi:hypothetical protein